MKLKYSQQQSSDDSIPYSQALKRSNTLPEFKDGEGKFIFSNVTIYIIEGIEFLHFNI